MLSCDDFLARSLQQKLRNKSLQQLTAGLLEQTCFLPSQHESASRFDEPGGFFYERTDVDGVNLLHHYRKKYEILRSQKRSPQRRANDR